jgi:hypothetical protein
MFVTPLIPRPSRPGTVCVMVAVCLTAILGAVAVSLDGGAMFAERRHAQAVADAAALAAACDLYENHWSHNGEDVKGTGKSSAEGTAKENGYNNDGVTNKVKVYIKPATGPYKGKRGYAEVVVEFYQRRNFATIFSSGDVTIRARAVAVGAPVATDVGILVLDPSKRGALSLNGGGASTVNKVPVVVNSADPEAVVANGGGSLTADKFVVAGGADASGGALSGTLQTGAPPVPDPLADLPAPDPTLMVKRSSNPVTHTSGAVFLLPGVYQGGISVSGTASLSLNPGVYYIDGGGFTFTAQGSLSGNGVTIYNAPSAGQPGGINVSGQSSISLSPPTSGPYQGITFFQARASNTPATVSGQSGTTNISGTFYFAGALLKVSASGGVVNLGSQYISSQLEIAGDGGVLVDWGPDKVGRKRGIYLVE